MTLRHCFQSVNVGEGIGSEETLYAEGTVVFPASRPLPHKLTVSKRTLLRAAQKCTSTRTPML